MAGGSQRGVNEVLDRHLRRVTRVNGMEVARSFLRNGITGRIFENTWDAYDPETGEVVATVTASRNKDAADMLIAEVYRHNCEIVYRRQGGLCFSCGGRHPLQYDHIVSRAKGRSDRPENLRGVCHPLYGCKAHSKRHGG